MIYREEIERDYIDAKKAGEILNLSPSRVSRLCSSGRFEGAFKNGGSWLIPRKAVENHTKLAPGVKPKIPSDKAIWEKALKEANNLKINEN